MARKFNLLDGTTSLDFMDFGTLADLSSAPSFTAFDLSSPNLIKTAAPISIAQVPSGEAVTTEVKVDEAFAAPTPPGPLFAPTVIWSDGFESATGVTSQAGVIRNAPNHADTFNGGGPDIYGSGDHFYRTFGDLGVGPGISMSVQNIQDTFYWRAEDLDGAVVNPDVINWTGIDISGQTNLSFTGFFAANFAGFDAMSDEIRIEVQIDGGGYNTVLLFSQELNTSLNGVLGLDADFNGVGDDTNELNNTLTSYTADIAGTGTTLDLRITVSADGGGEEIAFDQFSISSDSGGPIDGTPGNDVLRGTADDDEINGLAGNDTLAGYAGNDVINGGDDNDRLFGNDGDDMLNGGDGNDQLWGQAGADTLDGGAGTDGAYYINSASAVTLNVFTGGTAGDAAGDTYTNIERFYGSNFGDNLTGAGGNDFLYGLGGNDIINGAGGNDLLIGGVGVDNINGGDDNDNLIGGAGGDLLNGDAGNDNLRGGADNDMLNGGDGNDTLDGGSGADMMDGGAGIDRTTYIAADAGVSASLATGGTGGDATGDTYSNIENLYGSNFGDTLEGDAANNLIVGLNGDDDLFGLGGNDRLFGSAGEDYLDGGDGNDTLVGGTGADTFAFLGTSSVSELDRIVDFEDGVDMIELEVFGFVDDFNDLILTQVGNNVLVKEDTASTGSTNDAGFLVYNTMVADLTAADFTIVPPPPMGEPLAFDFAGPASNEGAVAFFDNPWEVSEFEVDFGSLF